jgi:hypothetical protein
MHTVMTKNLFTPKVPILTCLTPSQHPKLQQHNTHSNILNLNTQNHMDKLSNPLRISSSTYASTLKSSTINLNKFF